MRMLEVAYIVGQDRRTLGGTCPSGTVRNNPGKTTAQRPRTTVRLTSSPRFRRGPNPARRNPLAARVAESKR
jgi:hypothetical protein